MERESLERTVFSENVVAVNWKAKLVKVVIVRIVVLNVNQW